MSESARLRCYYIFSDFLAGNVAWFLFNLLRYYTLPYNYGSMSLDTYFSMTMVLIGQALFPLLMVALFAVSGFYNEVFFKSRVEVIVNSYGLSLIGAIIIFFVALFNDSIDDRLKSYEMVIILWLLIGSLTIVPRLTISRRIASHIRGRRISFPSLIVGISKEGIALAHDLENRYPNMGFRIVGFVDVSLLDDAPTQEVACPMASEVSQSTHLPVYSLSSLPRLLESTQIDAFIMAPSELKSAGMVSVINRLFPLGKSIYITPDLLQMITLRPRTRMVSGEVLIDISKGQIPESTKNLKRIGDVVVSSIALMVLLPFLGVIALLVKLGSPGPVIYTQERIGYKKKPFMIYKFRSMVPDCEKDGPALSSPRDPRITPIGHFLRKYRLDELPQFWNVLRGDMSLVGPRPEREFFLRQIIARAPYFSLLHQVRPGITSWGMVKYGYAENVDQMLERAKYDLLYIDNVSLIVDLKIMLYTFDTIISGRGI